MIYKITIENFFSIADAQTLSYKILDNAPDRACFVKSPSGNMRLPVAVGLFGANASGKSTVLRALVSTMLFMVHSFDWHQQQAVYFFQPYRKKEWLNKATKIAIEFDATIDADNSNQMTLFRYELHLNHVGEFSNKIILYEALSYVKNGRFQRLFERNEQDFYFSEVYGISNGKDPRKDMIRPDASVICTLMKANHALSARLCEKISQIQSNIVGVLESPSPQPAQWMQIYAKDQRCLDRLNTELRRLDIGLESMSIEIGNHGVPFAKFKHVGLDGDIYFLEESSGTRRFIEMLPMLYYALEKGSIAVIDEIDKDFHPFILPELIRWFSDPTRNPKMAQLFFTAQNPALLDELEKEQIFFAEKQSGKPTQIYGALDIKGLRRQPSLMKKYLSGELGAIPYIG